MAATRPSTLNRKDATRRCSSSSEGAASAGARPALEKGLCMSGARVLGGRKGLKVEGHGPILPGHYDEELVAALEVIGPASLASLRQGLRRFSPGQFKFVVLSIVDISPEKLAANPDKFLRGPVEIRLSESDEDALDLDNEFYAFAAIYGDPDEGLPSVKR